MSLSPATLDVQLQRMVVVEQRIVEKGWSLDTCEQIANELGVSSRTVWRYWRRVRRWTSHTLDAQDIETWRAMQLQRLMDLSRAAEKAEDYNSAVRAVEAQAKITGTIAPLKADVRVSGAVAHVPVTTDTVALLTELHALAEQRASAIEATAEVVPGAVVVDIPATPRDEEKP